MAAVLLEIRRREETLEGLLACVGRLTPLERLLWYPRALAALRATEASDPASAAPAQALLLAVGRDLERLEASRIGPS